MVAGYGAVGFRGRVGTIGRMLCSTAHDYAVCVDCMILTQVASLVVRTSEASRVRHEERSSQKIACWDVDDLAEEEKQG